MSILDFFRSDKLKNNFQETMEKQKEKTIIYNNYYNKKTKKKKITNPKVEILFSDMSKIEEFEEMIEQYYKMDFKLAGGISMHGSALCATLIKES